MGILLAASYAVAFEKPKPKMAVVAGSVFREPGFALPGVQVTLQPEPAPDASKKVRRMKAVSDARGEFAFQVPPVAARYTLIFEAKGFESEKRQVSIEGEQREDVFVTMKPAREVK